MDENLNPYGPGPGAQPKDRIGRRLPRAALTGGLAVGLALGGAGLAYAATSGGSSATSAASKSTPTTAPAGPEVRGPRHAGRFGLGFGALGHGKVMHGTFTVRSGSGYKTVTVQMGQVVSVSKSTITVKSPDGFEQTYSVLSTTIVDAQAGGISSVGGGDQVDVIASSANGHDTAINIVDGTKMRASRKGFGFGPPAAKPGSGSPGATGFGGFGGGGPGGDSAATEAQ